jgi:hypothetical protein
MEDRFEANCTICGSLKSYKSIKTFNICKDLPCLSCSNSIQRGGTGNVKTVDGNKKCSTCKETKPIEEFYFYKNKNRHLTICLNCKKENFKKYQKTIGRFKRHGITKEIYEEMYTEQSGKCFTCNNNHDILYIDHNHSTNKLRKLLCRDCNSAIGFVKENINTLNNIIKYLKKHG